MNTIIRNFFKFIFIFVLSLASFSSYAENSKEFGDYVIHYNAFRSDALSPEMAKEYDLTRASNRVLINIVVLRKVLKTTGKPITAKVTGHASNLAGQLKVLEFKEITSGNAIYYLADIKISGGGEFLRFNLQITPEGETRAARLRFNQHFSSF